MAKVTWSVELGKKAAKINDLDSEKEQALKYARTICDVYLILSREEVVKVTLDNGKVYMCDLALDIVLPPEEYVVLMEEIDREDERVIRSWDE